MNTLTIIERSADRCAGRSKGRQPGDGLVPPLDDFTVVRRRMAKARKAAGLTQEGLAEDAGVAIDVVKYWETGRLTMVLPKDSPNLRALCLVLDVEAARKALGADSVEPAAILEGLL